MNTPVLNQSFLAGEQIQGLRFKHNDYVSVISGPHAGIAGSLVSLLSLDPEPIFVMELESGRDAEVAQTDIQLVNA
jgi:transcription antitermination factor NusG